MLNCQRFQLEDGSHPNRKLQEDWNELGADAFEFEVLDRLEPQGGATHDLTEKLRVLKEMWLNNLSTSGESMYQRSLQGS